jgi:hypothetical protein
MVEEPDRVSTNNEDYDAYDGTKTSGGIVDNPSIHIYIAHQIPETVTEGEQYEPPTPTTNQTAEEDTEENSDDESSTENKKE